jgi:hypothetical protein
MTVSNQLAKNSGFNMSVSNMQDALQMATMISNSQLAPANYKGRPEDTLVAMMMGHEVGLNPMQSIQNIAVINGKPSIYGDAMLALVQNHYSFGGINESYDENTKTAKCTVWRKGGAEHEQTFSKVDAETAGLWGRKGPWSTSPKRMLAMRARGFALRNQFADALLGLISAEEAEDMPRAERDVTPQGNVVSIDNQPLYISEAQAQEIEKLANSEKLLTVIKSAYKVGTLTDISADKFEECKARIASFLEKANANN